MLTNEPSAGTHFLPAERTAPAVLAGEIARAARSPVITALLEASESAAAILDPQRQVIAFNPAYLITAGVEEPAQALGLRPGEALHCVFVEGVSGGCGTTPACPTCGAALAILSATTGQRPEERRCALAVWRDGVRIEREFLARATPVRLEEEPFLLFTLRDVSAEARRARIERALVDDLSSLVVGLESAAGELAPGNEVAAGEVRLLAQQLAHEVRLQKVLTDGGRSEALRLARRPFEVSDAISLLRRTVEHHPSAAGRTVEWPRVTTGVLVPADPGLLHHVLMNMVVNALEAVPPGGRVRVEVSAGPDRTSLRVWNPGTIPAAVVPRIFQRYFSTKGESGHGQGTWSMKLFGEEILGGRVSFETSPVEGTTFQVAFARVGRPSP